MYLSKCCPLVAIVPISIFLTASFFVLFALRKVAEKWLKIFGYLAVSSLLLASLVILSVVVSNRANGLGGMKCNLVQKMKMCGMANMMHQKNMPDMSMPEKGTLPNE